MDETYCPATGFAFRIENPFHSFYYTSYAKIIPHMELLHSRFVVGSYFYEPATKPVRSQFEARTNRSYVWPLYVSGLPFFVFVVE
ncbi:MAG TPA: hypothetical protein DCR43_09565 [Bacteroidales bacterium]|nr:MAG: hypothetical protein A2X11_11450 [Bacteroidetes bacterium GWE2_42_24]OFY25524.1 MAG: hypothetical protein A2X09_07050 [Bacteroidetes bacterium GWF2_43_11]HAQ66081.1 hypothetical protein [Bacteroidales bacterium]HBZ66369.1 hypothetical protein [Bacteroidales bacterium]